MSVKLPIVDRADANPIAGLGPGSPDEAALEDARLLRVGDLAQRTNKTVRALHLYEELGLLKPSERSKGGFRLYGAEAVTRVRWITKLQEMGFSLPEIREMVTEWETSGSATHAMHRVRDLYRQKLDETRSQLAKLEALKAELERSVNYLDTCNTCDPERLVHSCARCDLDHGCSTPELVAGLHSQRH
jgi:DNA-binding transcriptional MerR regulator